MEDVLDLYEEPYDPQYPTVCLDEKPVVLHADVQPPVPVEPGQPERVDYEYERRGTRNLFVMVEPLAGWRHVEVTAQRTMHDYAKVVRWLVDEVYPQAEHIRLVQDNLNTHTPASLYETFPPAEARRILRRLEFHYTPKHGSWLNMAEIEIAILERNALSRRLADEVALRRQVLAVEQETAQEKRYRIMSPHLRQSARSMTSDALYSHVRRDNRYARYEAVRALQQQGFSLREISRRLKVSRQTVRRFVRAESFPERNKAPQKASLLDPYKPYLLKRWQEGCWNGAQLYAEIKAGGYTGSAPLLRRFITELRKQRHAAASAASLTHETSGAKVFNHAELSLPPQYIRRLAPTRASWLYVSKPEKLDEKQRQQVAHIRQGHRDLDTAYQLSQAFVSMLSERRGNDLDEWLIQAQHSGIAELKSFAQGIRRDYAAVHAAFTSPWSNRQVEAQVNRLKVQKRQVYGRAKIDLLRRRVLYRA